MLIVTAKLPRRKLAAGVAVAALLCCTALVLNLGRTFSQETAAPAAPSPKGVKTAEDRVDYLIAWGWEVAPEPVSTEELLIPQAFDESYADYLTLQREQGFDLEKYAGKRVKRYTYAISNYPTGEQGIVLNLLLYKNTVVGGEVISPTLDGFLHGLAKP